MSGGLPKVVATAAVLGLAGAARAMGQQASCPAPLAEALRLVVVTAAGFETSTASIRTFQRVRAGAAWEPRLGPLAVTLGRSGLGWGWTAGELRQGGEPIRQTGDNRTPAGIFRVRRAFGSKPTRLPGFLVLAKGETFCVDDPASEHYGRIVPHRLAGWKTTGEDMAANPLYASGLEVDYPPNAQRRAGGCLFIHIWRRPGVATTGSIATSEQTVRHLQGFTSAQPSAIAILPEAALARLKTGCLPHLG
ncbi:MAG: hypothetical protein R3D27_07050 [Hyphomicrobiaceae bacterium]